MKKIILLSFTLMLCTQSPALTATRLVPDEYTTIQAAIDDCNDGDTVIVGPGTYMEKLYLSDPLQYPLMRRVVKAIGLPAASNGLDAGCGVGLQIPPLAEAVGPGGHVTGLDILPEFINEAGRNLGLVVRNRGVAIQALMGPVTW